MASVTMTLMGLYNYDTSLFDFLTLPEDIDKDTLVDNILLRSGDFEVLYPDFDFLKFSIGAWARKWQPTFERWIAALQIEYNPLENYDRKEDWTDTRNGSTSGETSGTTNTTSTNKVSAYDATDFSNKDQNEIYGSDSSSSSGESHEGAKHDGRIHGNIGVTTSQQMLTQELDIGYWNIYEKITDLFLTEFVLPVY